MSTKPDFSKEDLIGTPVEYAPGCWVAGELHHPVGVKNAKLNNRAFIYKLTLKEDLAGVKAGSKCLFVFGLGKKPILEGIQKLQESTGLKVVALMCNGGSHHINIKFFYDAFPDIAVWVCPTRVPLTSNAKYLIENYPDRWELVDNTTVPHHAYQLLRYFGSGDDMQVDCIIFNQLWHFSDKSSQNCGCWGAPGDEPKLQSSMWVITEFSKLGQDLSCPEDDIVFFHKASGLIVTGHHWEFAYVPKEYNTPSDLQWEGSFLFTKLVYSAMHSPGSYSTGLGRNKNRLRDAKIHAEQWNEVMKWDFKYGCSHHDVLGACGPLDDSTIMESEGGLKGHMKRELEKSGELNAEPIAGSWFPWKYPNALYKVQAKEPGYVKAFGEPEELRYGGPDFDAYGVKIMEE